MADMGLDSDWFSFFYLRVARPYYYLDHGNMGLVEYCHDLPKVELHAHLNGSLSLNTLKKLYQLQQPDGLEVQEYDDIESLTEHEEIFKVFDIAYSLTNSPKAVYIATCDVIQEFSEENVIYLELRSTPRKVEGSMTKKEYTESIISAIKKCEEKFKIIVKYLVSVNRKLGEKEAKENIELAIAMQNKYPQYIVGLDLSGDPSKGSALLDLLEKARGSGLKIAAHCGEVPNETEIMDILNFKPDRLGHCTCIHQNLNGTEELFKTLTALKIPIELCPSSNLKTKSVPSYQEHHFQYFYEVGHPVCISTDDKGVFGTTLSKEFEIVASTFNLEKSELKKISTLSVSYSFACDNEKEILLKLIDDFNDFALY